MATSKPSSVGVTSTTRSDRALQHGRGSARRTLQSALKIGRMNRRTELNWGLMLNILIAEGTPATWQAERAGFGLPSNFSLLAAAVQLHRPDIRCTPLNIADGEDLPVGTSLSDFDGVMIPGSPLHIYHPGCLCQAADRFRSRRLCRRRARLGQLLGLTACRDGSRGIGPAQPAGPRAANCSGDHHDGSGPGGPASRISSRDFRRPVLAPR